ncbi:hypothetical protein KR038_001227 [Drosophila bunnanda]|nr:hypothetical protein KR038_001227 [Drosophila bunnanda]
MIGTEDMSGSTGMDISESFRAEDLSKADFFDFVTGPDMSIGLGVGVGVGVEALGVTLHQQQQQHQHHQSHQSHQNHQQAPHSHNSHNSNHVQVVHQSGNPQSQQQSLCGGGGARTTSSMIHDGGGGAGAGANGGGVVVPVGNRNGSSNNGDPTLQGYEFWHQDKDNNRLDSSSIFEDLDRYCWQQQPVTASASNGVSTSTNQPSPTSPQSHLQQQQQQQQQQQHPQLHQQQQQQPNANSSSGASSGAGSSSDTISSLDTTDGQIYTLTVLNGGEPWLKRSEAEQLPSSLDLDSLLSSFPGYIKSEYPYDDSGFSTDGKDVIGSGADGSGLNQTQNQGQQTPQALPSLVTAISLAGGNDLGQQLAQFQNNNNDWHMADHNTDTEQSTAESLLRSALQGKGYAKGLHMQNGLTMPIVKDEDMRRLLFADEAAALGFADSTLSAAQIFDEAQGIHLSSQQHQQQQQQQQQQQHNGSANILVDDMFLSLENAFSDDFEKIKRIANEVQQFCSTPTPGDYGPSAGDVLMQISPSPAASVAGQLQPPQPLKPEVSTSTSPSSSVGVSKSSSSGGGVSKPKKQYKRSSSGNNNNPSVANNNSSANSSNPLGPVIGATGSNGSSSSSGSASSSSNSPPANSGGSSSSSSGGSGQRKERSLHYCSICSKGFKDKYSVNVHIRTHTGEKPFACSLCGKSFRQKAHLAKHYQTHMTQKNNGNLIKGSSGKHQRSSGSSSSAAAAAAAAALNPRQQLGGGGVVQPSLPVMISNPNTPPGVLPPANGLLSNR